MTATLNVSMLPAETAAADERQVITVITGDAAQAIAAALAHTLVDPSVSATVVEPPPAAPPKHKQLVSRRTFDGLRPRAPRVPTTEEDSLALRMAELKRRRKGAGRQAQLLRSVPVIHVPAEIVTDIEYEPAAPAAFVVIDLPGDTP